MFNYICLPSFVFTVRLLTPQSTHKSTSYVRRPNYLGWLFHYIWSLANKLVKIGRWRGKLGAKIVNCFWKSRIIKVIYRPTQTPLWNYSTSSLAWSVVYACVTQGATFFPCQIKLRIPPVQPFYCPSSGYSMQENVTLSTSHTTNTKQSNKCKRILPLTLNVLITVIFNKPDKIRGLCSARQQSPLPTSWKSHGH